MMKDYISCKLSYFMTLFLFVKLDTRIEKKYLVDLTSLKYIIQVEICLFQITIPCLKAKTKSI